MLGRSPVVGQIALRYQVRKVEWIAVVGASETSPSDVWHTPSSSASALGQEVSDGDSGSSSIWGGIFIR
jgi:hypothetical protein